MNISSLTVGAKILALGAAFGLALSCGAAEAQQVCYPAYLFATGFGPTPLAVQFARANWEQKAKAAYPEAASTHFADGCHTHMGCVNVPSPQKLAPPKFRCTASGQVLRAIIK